MLLLASTPYTPPRLRPLMTRDTECPDNTPHRARIRARAALGGLHGVQVFRSLALRYSQTHAHRSIPLRGTVCRESRDADEVGHGESSVIA